MNVEQITVNDLRPEVADFAIEMERTLRQHDDTKGATGWKKEDNNWLFGLIDKKVLNYMKTPPQSLDSAQTIMIDIANIAMMVWDNMTSRDNKE